MANLKREINKDQAKADEIKSLRARIKSQGKLLDQYEKQIEDVRKAKYKLPRRRERTQSLKSKLLMLLKLRRANWKCFPVTSMHQQIQCH